jgi:hypothetical protein
MVRVLVILAIDDEPDAVRLIGKSPSDPGHIVFAHVIERILFRR